ncbi:MAG: YlbF family regulator [Phycisphaerales bacterium]|nr:YlbF family regulator [Phycisphaerales bacterium]
MADTPQIIEAATRLGRLLAEHPAVARYRELLKAVRKDTDAQRLLADYSRHMDAISEKEQAGQPIEVQDKHKLADLQSRVAMHPQLREMQMAQMDYVDLMRKVDEAMASAGEVGETPAGEVGETPAAG